VSEPQQTVRLDRESEHQTAAIRILSYNIFAPNRLDPLAELIRENKPDIVCLQEVRIPERPSRTVDRIEWLAEQLGMYPAVMPTHRGRSGLVANVVLMHQPARSTEVLTDVHGFKYGLGVILECDKTELALICGHYAWVPRPLMIGVWVSVFQRSVQLRRSLNWLARQNLPGIIAGDFNMLPYSLEYRMLARRLIDCSRAVPANHRSTRPTWGLPAQLDYIFTTSQLKTRHYETVDFDFSDHRPILADLSLDRVCSISPTGPNPSR
jgi:endonuclease/exonuclease/phosphatase family metal-dependent hydrolase